MSLTENFSSLARKFVGSQPKAQTQTDGLENFKRNLEYQLAEIDYNNRFRKAVVLLDFADKLFSWIPESKKLSKGAPAIAVVVLALLLEACDIAPRDAEAQTGAQPKTPATLVTRATPEDLSDLDPDLIETVKELATRSANPTPQPTPDSTSTPEPPTPIPTNEQSQPPQEQSPSPEAKVITAVVSANSNLRSDHNITSAIVARLTSGENVVVIGKIDYPTGTYDWYEIQRTIGKRERGFIRGDLLGVSPTMTVPVEETLSAPTPAPKPPTIRESQTTKEVSVTYITPAVNTITFSNPYTQEGRAPGLVITNPQRFKVLTDNHPWYEIVFGGNRVWILATQDTVIEKGTEKVVVQASGPVVTNPETAPTTTGTHFSGIYTGGVWYIPEVELNLSDGGHNKRVVWSPETATITPVTGWVAEASNVTVYQNEGNLIFNVGAVDQNADGSYSVLGNRLNSSYVVYIYIKDDAGNDTATNTKLQYSPSMVSINERVGVLGGNLLLLFVSRDK